MADIKNSLYDGAVLARDAELASDAIDKLELIVRETGILVLAERNGHLSLSPRHVRASRFISWQNLSDASGNPFPNMISEVVGEMNAEPTTKF